MPKATVDRGAILKCAVELVRRNGFEGINARSLAREAGYSVQPIYSYFNDMESLRAAVIGEAMHFYNEFIYSRVTENVLLSMAKANVAFAKYETNLFKLLFFRELKGIDSFDDIYEWMGDKSATQAVAEKLGLTPNSVKEIYIMMIIFTHGVAAMTATDGAKVSDDEIAEMLERAYKAFIALQTTEKE